MKYAVIVCLALAGSVSAAIREVGAGKTHATIESAYAVSTPGDTILVYPGASAYKGVALFVSRRNIHFRGVSPSGSRIALSGEGFSYSGAGSVPRAMFQFNKGADSCTVENFEISGCRNSSNNGAGIRINEGNGVVVRNCDIHHNDMGIMSNGSVAAATAAGQVIENCVVHDNGNTAHAGYNHNFYLGGTSVTVRGCNVYNATTGHNIKSRAHLTIIDACFVHDSPNRELDLVDDSENTMVDGSHALITGCIIVKHSSCPGNRNVIHFGQDGSSDHRGKLFIVNSTILTPYVSAVVDVSAPSAGLAIYNCIVTHPTAPLSGQVLISIRGGALASNISGSRIWSTTGFSVPQGVVLTDRTESLHVLALQNVSSGYAHISVDATAVIDKGLLLGSIPLAAPFAPLVLNEYTPAPGYAVRNIEGQLDIGAREWRPSAVHSRFAGSGASAMRRQAAAADLQGRTLPPLGVMQRYRRTCAKFKIPR